MLFFFLPTTLAVIGLTLTIQSRLLEGARVGEVIESRITGGPLRLVTSGLLLGGVVLAATVQDGELAMFLPMVVASLLVNYLRPREQDRVVGLSGVRVGWNSCRFSELEEWRLTGDHLRFKLFGQWTAVPLAVDKQEPVREQLMQVAADRESAFNQ